MVALMEHPRIRVRVAAIAALAAIVTAWGLLVATPAVAAATPGISFDPPTATAVLLRPLVFTDTFRTSTEPSGVELVVSSPYVPGVTIETAQVTRVSNGTWRASVSQADTGSVNTVYNYAFRVTLPGGIVQTGPSGSVTVVDQRFAWQTISGPDVTLHWYGHSRGTAQGWLQDAESAVTRDEAAFGIASVPHLDFFIYNDSASFFDAIGAGANADAAGVYIADTHTAFGTVLASDLGSDFPAQEIAHETTHHVFGVATQNPYHAPPLWLDEGLAVYYSEGPGPRRADLQQGIAAGRIVPLDGLSEAFPSGTDAFVLSYAEAVSAVDYLIRTYGQASLQRLVVTYRQGATDDEAFRAATGASASAFDAAWLTSIGVRSIATYGPRPAPTGPLPPGWTPTTTPGGQSAMGPVAPRSPSGPPLAGFGIMAASSSVGVLLATSRRRLRPRRGRP